MAVGDRESVCVCVCEWKQTRRGQRRERKGHNGTKQKKERKKERQRTTLQKQTQHKQQQAGERAGARQGTSSDKKKSIQKVKQANYNNQQLQARASKNECVRVSGGRGETGRSRRPKGIGKPSQVQKCSQRGPKTKSTRRGVGGGAACVLVPVVYSLSSSSPSTCDASAYCMSPWKKSSRRYTSASNVGRSSGSVFQQSSMIL